METYANVLIWFIIVPLIPAFILFLLGYLKVMKRRDWEKTDAIVVEDHSFGIGYPKPIVKYEVDGISYEVQSNVGQRTYLRAGRGVQVFYNPRRRDEMMIDTFIQRGSVYFLIGSVFLVFSISAVILLKISQYLHSILGF